MPSKLFKSDMGLRIDKTSVLVDISAYINSASMQAAITMLEDTGAGVSMPTFLNGIAKIQLPINGVLNTTTEAVFGPCLKGTATSKTVEFKAYAGRFYNGECLPGSVQFSGSRDTLETFSATLHLTGTLNRTSAALP